MKKNTYTHPKPDVVGIDVVVVISPPVTTITNLNIFSFMRFDYNMKIMKLFVKRMSGFV